MALDRSIGLRLGLPGIPVPDLTRLIAQELARYGSLGPANSRGRSEGANIAPGLTPAQRIPSVWSAPATDIILHLPKDSLKIPGELVVYVPGAVLTLIPEIVSQLYAGTRSSYAVLDDYGVLLINSAATIPNGIVLAGGSHCVVSLQQQDGRWVVVKSASRGRSVSDVDSLHRHQNEAEWLSAVNQFSARFVTVESIAADESSYTFISQFFPGYSAAELLFQGRLTGSLLADILIRIYSELQAELYSRGPIAVRWPDTDLSYVERIRRRRRSLLQYMGSTYPAVSALLTARRIRVNGRACPSLATLLDIVENDLKWQPMAHPRVQHACHGDLILEDILLSPAAIRNPGSRVICNDSALHPDPAARDIRLIDPNPYNTHVIWDLAKTMLSLWLGYEILYFDMFEISAAVSGESHEVDIEISLGADYCQAELSVASAQFMAFAETELAHACGLDGRDFQRSVRMASALTALAIPAFHVIAHGKPDRAMAFISLGLLHASYALTGCDVPGVC